MTAEKISAWPFIVIGCIGSALLALLSASGTPHTWLTWWMGFYGLMLLLVPVNLHSLAKWNLTNIAPILLSLLASLPFYWTTSWAFAPFGILFFSALALNAWHIQYQKNRFAFSYSALFHAVWDSFIKLSITLFFVLLCWIIVLICNVLFKSIQITLIDTLIKKTWFDVFISGVFASAGLYIASISENVIYHVRTILIMICRYLLIPLSVIGILFILLTAIKIIQTHTLPRSRFEFLLMAFLSGLFLNGIYQDGKAQDYYPRFLFWLCRIFIWITPIFPLFALHTLYFREFDIRTFSDIMNASVLLLYNTTYAVIAMGRQKPLFKPIEKANVMLSIILIAAALLSSNPWITSHIPLLHIPA